MEYRILIIAIFIWSCSSAKKVVKPEALSNTHDINLYVENAILDNLDQIHVINKEGALIRYSESLELLYKYADITSGPIQNIDVTNPLSTLVYHRDFGIISYLDNSLALIRKTNLQDLGFYDINTVAYSNDGNVWLYDPGKNEILKIDEAGTVLLRSNNLNDYRLQDLNPDIIIERDNRLFVYDPTQGIIIFDNLGQYLKVLPIKNVNSFQTDGEQIYIYKDEKLKAYSIRLLEESEIDIKSNLAVDNVLISPRFIYYIYADGIDRVLR